MQDSTSVITAASKGIAEDLAAELEVSLGRCYEILAKDNPLPKAKRLIRAIGRVDKSKDKKRIRLIKADLDAMFCQILADQTNDVDCAEFHLELSEAVQVKIAGKSSAECLKEFREARVILDMAIHGLEKDEARIDNGFRANGYGKQPKVF